MPVPYRKTPRAAEFGHATYLDILWIASDRTFYGGLLVIDGKGQPQEFVHNTLVAPSGLLWTEEKVIALGVAMLAHSLFDSCRREPDLLVSLAWMGSPEYCRTEIAPSIPFAQVVPPQDGLPAEWNWVNDPPSPGMRATILAQELERRGYIVEPFERLRHALRLVSPNASWDEVATDGF